MRISIEPSLEHGPKSEEELLFRPAISDVEKASRVQARGVWFRREEEACCYDRNERCHEVRQGDL